MNPLQVMTKESAPVTATDTGVKATVYFPRAVRIVKVGYIVTTTSTAAAIVDVDKKADASASAVEVQGAISKPASNQQGVKYAENVSVDLPAGGVIEFDFTTNTASQGAVCFVEYTDAP